MIELGVNIDHVATLRQQRLTTYPDPIEAALRAEEAGADLITLHLREDRRHIQDADVERMRPLLRTRMNLECAITPEMLAIACRIRPQDVCLVPEKREELTTEGGLDVAGHFDQVKRAVDTLHDAGVRVSLFIDPEENQIEASARAGATVIELHTGAYAEVQEVNLQRIGQGGTARDLAGQAGAGQGRTGAANAGQASHAHDGGNTQAAVDAELSRLHAAIALGISHGLRVNAGHGLHYHNVGAIVALPGISELNIGHAIVAQAIFDGWEKAVRDMKALLVAR